MQVSEPFSGPTDADVCVIGLGYVGLTLAVALATVGVRVLGYEINWAACQQLMHGRLHFHEPGLVEGIQRTLGRTLTITAELPPKLPPIVILCVGTPIDETTMEPDLRQLAAAATSIANHLEPETLVIVRSTVPVGTSRHFIRPLLASQVAEPQIAFCPERTIQGKALEELNGLPQIVGGLDAVATARASELFARLTSDVLTVSSIETAELIKLVCNAHTDLIYGYGNQVAVIAEALGLDADEVIATANLRYPRPDLSRPGFVGGSCLSKDPYLLIHSTQQQGCFPSMVATARRFNESIPLHVAGRVIAALERQFVNIGMAKVLISGFAYKGHPETDDLRGSPAGPILQLFRERVRTVVGHDFIVLPERIAAMGAEPVSLADGFAEAHAALILNNHRSYQTIDIGRLAQSMNPGAILFDVWGMFGTQFAHQDAPVHYMRLGHG
jgi:UDP-N-acetyl-D-mannosaminuronic acid dehydrogenase